MRSSANPSGRPSHRSTHSLTPGPHNTHAQLTHSLTNHGTTQTQGFRRRLDAHFHVPRRQQDQGFAQAFHGHARTPQHMCTALSRHATDFHNMPDHQHATTLCPRPPAAGRAIQRRTRNVPEHTYFVAPGACGPARKNNGLVKKSYAGRNHHSRPNWERRSGLHGRTKRLEHSNNSRHDVGFQGCRQVPGRS